MTVALAGNPNVGKSTVFNALTGMRQHTGNWPGKTVENARGFCRHRGREYLLVDLPGCYSLTARSAEEQAARDFICSGQPDAVVVVCDASCLERNLILVLQVMEITPHVIVCVNLMDEAKKKHIDINTVLLAELLGVPVVETAARNRQGLDMLMDEVSRSDTCRTPGYRPAYPAYIESAGDTLSRIKEEWAAAGITSQQARDDVTQTTVRTAEQIAARTVVYRDQAYDRKDRRWDRLLTGRLTGFPVMIAVLGAVFWLTITGANYPSALLSKGLFWIEGRLSDFFIRTGIPQMLTDALVLGIYRTLAWVVAVMLPPIGGFIEYQYPESFSNIYPNS